MKRQVSMVSSLLLGAAVAAAAQGLGGGFSGPTAQNPGIPASVTSMRPGNFNPGIPASVTSQRPVSGLLATPNFGEHHRHHFRRNHFIPVYVPVYSYPVYPVGEDYVPDNGDQYPPDYVSPQSVNDAGYQPQAPQPPGPTVMEPGYRPAPLPPPESITNTGSNAQSAPASANAQAPAATAEAFPSQPSESSAQPAEPEPETVLVFKDGHVTEIGNYVIVGGTLYNLSGSYRQYKIALADLDLDATIKANEDRGLEFHLPKQPS